VQVSAVDQGIAIYNPAYAPETRGSHCEAEFVAGLKAKERLAGLLRSGPLTIRRMGEDRYRRTLTRVLVRGRDAGEVLVAEGLALRWQPGADAKASRLRHWCKTRTQS
jgi:micrococcal nuclease